MLEYDLTRRHAGIVLSGDTRAAALQAAPLFAIEPAWSSLGSVLNAYWL